MSIIEIRKSETNFVRKLEGDEELREILTNAFEGYMVYARMSACVKRLTITAQLLGSGGIISEEDLKMSGQEDFWENYVKEVIYQKIVGHAVENYFYASETWDLKDSIRKVISEDVTSESLVKAIEMVEVEVIRNLREQL